MAAREVFATSDVKVRIMELEEGVATEWHHHSEVDDFFVCLAGVIRVEAKDRQTPVVLHPGQRVQVKSPVVHRVVNQHYGASEYLLVQGVGSYDFVRDAV